MLEHILIITVAVLISQFRVLRYGYVSDDIPVYQNPPKLKNKWDKIFKWILGEYKWLPKYDHLMTMFVHILVSVAIYFAFGANTPAFFAALMFSIHPAGMHGSVWISGRCYPLVVLMLLLALAVPLAGPVFILLGSFFTAGFLAPLVLIGSGKAWLLLFIPWAWLLWGGKFTKAVKFKAESETVVEDKKFHIGKIALGIKTIGFYLALAVFPQKVAFYHWFLQSCAGSQKDKAYSLCKYFWIGLVAIIGWAVYSCYRWDMISYGFLWFLIGILPFSNFRRVTQEISERYLYLPLVGVMVAIAYALAPYPWALLVIVGFYWGRFHSVVSSFRDDFWIVEGSVYEDPFAWYGWHFRAVKRWNCQSFHEAMIFWTLARSHSPKEFKILYNLAVVFKVINKHQQFKQLIEEAEKNIIPGQEEQAKELIKRLRNNQPVQILL